MNGIDIQYLDGIDIQYLDGVQTMTPAQRQAVSRINAFARRNAEARQRAIAAATAGFTNKVAAEADHVSVGADFLGFAGDASIEDEEMLRNYIARTKRVIDASPNIALAYQSPKQLSDMLGYVLSKWDTAEREAALDQMIANERKLGSLGAINVNVAGDQDVLSEEQMADVDVQTYGKGEAKRTFLTAVKKSLNPRLTTEAQDLVAANPATIKMRNALRQRTAKNRTTKNISVIDRAGQRHSITVQSATTPSALNGFGVSDDMQQLMSGTDLIYGDNDPLMCIALYLQRTRKVAMQHPEVFQTKERAIQVGEAIDRILRAWQDPAVRDRVISEISNDQALDGFLKNAVKKVAAAIKKVAKKIGKAVKKVVKKVVKVVVRYNPLTLLIRAGILGFCRLNMFKVSNKCYPGSLTESAAAAKGISSAEWKKSNEAYKHLANAYTKLGGKESKLKSVLEKGNKKKWEGTEYPTDANAIKAIKISDADDKEARADSDYNDAMAEYTQKGYVSDSSVSADVATVSKQETVEVVENERTTKVATNIRETDDASGKSLISVPKGAKVLVDTTQTSDGFIAANYGGKDGWIKQADLAGLGACDAESVAVLAAGAMWDKNGNVNGLGEPATATAIASASATIASIMAKIKSIFGVAKDVIDVASAGKNIVTSIKNKDAQGVMNAAGQMMTAANNATQNASNVAPGSQALQTASAAMNKVSQTGQQVQQTATTLQNNIQAAASSLQNKVQTAASSLQNNVQTAATNAANTVNLSIKDAKAAATSVVNKVATAAAPVVNTVTAVTQTAKEAESLTKIVDLFNNRFLYKSAPQIGAADATKAPYGLSRKLAARDHIATADLVKFTPGVQYTFECIAYREKGSVALGGGLWVNNKAATYGPMSKVCDIDGNWALYRKSFTPTFSNGVGVRPFFQINQAASGGSTVWHVCNVRFYDSRGITLATTKSVIETELKVAAAKAAAEIAAELAKTEAAAKAAAEAKAKAEAEAKAKAEAEAKAKAEAEAKAKAEQAAREAKAAAEKEAAMKAAAEQAAREAAERAKTEAERQAAEAEAEKLAAQRMAIEQAMTSLPRTTITTEQAAAAAQPSAAATTIQQPTAQPTVAQTTATAEPEKKSNLGKIAIIGGAAVAVVGILAFMFKKK